LCPKLIRRHRIIAPIFNSTLHYILESHSRSSHFAQIRCYVPLEWERQAEKLRIFVVLLCHNKPFIPFTNTSSRYQQFVLTDKHYWERSLIHSAKRCTGTSSEGVW